MRTLAWAIVSVPLCIIAFLQVIAAAREECPPPENVYPCYCEEEDEDLPEIHCNHLTTERQLVLGLKGLKDYKAGRITFWRNEVPVLKSNTFQGLYVQRISFENSTLKLEAPQFVGLEQSLSEVRLSGCFNSTYPMPKWSLGHMEKLKEIIVERNNISTLEDDWLESVHRNLRFLWLTENGFEELGHKVFAKVEGLTFLYLDGNKLNTVKRSMFPSPAENLRSISLNHNKIETLPFDIFKDMPNLRTLELEDNSIRTLDETTWSPIVQQLRVLNLSGNPVRCDSSLKWMYAIGSSRPPMLSGTCDSPKRLKGQSLDTLSSGDII